MLESSPACPETKYSHIVHSPEGLSPVAPQLNYITDIVLELKAELAKIKTEVKEIKNQLSLVHLSLINEIRHSGKAPHSESTAFQYKYPFQNPKNKKAFPLHDIKIQKEEEKSEEKSVEKEEAKDGV